MRKTLAVVLSILIVIEWSCVFFVDGVISVASWWFIMGSSFVGALLFVIIAGKTICRLVKRKGIKIGTIALLLVTLIMSYPICWFFGIGQIAYPADIKTTKPIAVIRLPLNETASVGWGGDSLETNYPHVVAPMERWAYDLLIKPYDVGSNKLSDYGIYGADVVCPSNGYVVDAYDLEEDILPNTEDNKTMMGNYIYIKIADTGTYLVLAHLKKDSVLVKKGQYVKEGQIIAKVGNSGSSSEPHLHIHHQRQNPKTTCIFFTEGLPLYIKEFSTRSMPQGGTIRDKISPVKTSNY
ncbi:M23 family metallopeptidase [Clostridiaceae bacterium M8S5]|nr:M23 family metallopeptidase [Clostridiaceae bacterium M8S5]